MFARHASRAREPGARRGPRRARPAGRRERAHPDRPRPARPARPLADHDHGQGRPGPPARASRSRPGPWTRSPRSRTCPGGRSPTCGPRCPATATSPWPASSPAAGSCCGPPASPPTCPGRRRGRPRPSGAVRLGRARRADQRGPPRPRQLVRGPAVPVLGRDRRRRRRRAGRPAPAGQRPGGPARAGQRRPAASSTPGRCSPGAGGCGVPAAVRPPRQPGTDAIGRSTR